MSTSQVNGVRIYWEIAGDVGDPLVLVHGSWGPQRSMWTNARRCTQCIPEQEHGAGALRARLMPGARGTR
jgi:pimeloyl-ACP methyl ester carboxylesterase